MRTGHGENCRAPRQCARVYRGRPPGSDSRPWARSIRGQGLRALQTVWPKPTSAEERAGAGHGDCWLVGPLAMPRGVAHTRTRRHSARRGGAVFRRVTLRRASLPLRRGLVCSERVSSCGHLHTFRGELSLPAPGVPLGGQRLAPVRHWLPGPSLAGSTARGAPEAAGPRTVRGHSPIRWPRS